MVPWIGLHPCESGLQLLHSTLSVGPVGREPLGYFPYWFSSLFLSLHDQSQEMKKKTAKTVSPLGFLEWHLRNSLPMCVLVLGSFVKREDREACGLLGFCNKFFAEEPSCQSTYSKFAHIMYSVYSVEEYSNSFFQSSIRVTAKLKRKCLKAPLQITRQDNHLTHNQTLPYIISA